MATRRIAAGDYTATVAGDRTDEIGESARSFNEMTATVKCQQEDLAQANHGLERANSDLESIVQNRTSQLEATNKRLSAEIAEKEDFLRAVSHDLNWPLRQYRGHGIHASGQAPRAV